MMVLAYKVGRERNFALVLLLFVVTFGIYGIYWNFKAHQEAFRQFELDRDGRDEGFIWLILGYVLFQPLLWVYHWLFVSNVRYVRERLGFARNLSVGTFLGLSISGSILAVLAFYMFLIFAPVVDEASTDAEWMSFFLWLGTSLIVVLIGVAMWVTAYGLLQRDLNQLWRAYDTRMMELTGRGPSWPARSAPGTPASTTQPTMSEWARAPPR